MMRSNLNRFNNITQRVITGLIGAAVVLGATYFSEWTFLIVFMGICIFTLLEFYHLVGLDGWIPLKSFGTISGAFMFLLFFFIERGSLEVKYYFLIVPLVSGIYLIKLYKKSDPKPFANIAITFLGILYVAMPIALFNLAARYGSSYNYEIIAGVMILLWASDTGAYFAGSRFGRRKLFERISPKKSWEGLFGGTLLALGVAWFLADYFTTLSLIQWIVVTLIIVISGTYGDLVESLFKRSMDIKDSGDRLPGHGGFLDRFDSLLLSMPFIIAYIEIF